MHNRKWNISSSWTRSDVANVLLTRADGCCVGFLSSCNILWRGFLCVFECSAVLHSTLFFLLGFRINVCLTMITNNQQLSGTEAILQPEVIKVQDKSLCFSSSVMKLQSWASCSDWESNVFFFIVFFFFVIEVNGLRLLLRPPTCGVTWRSGLNKVWAPTLFYTYRRPHKQLRPCCLWALWVNSDKTFPNVALKSKLFRNLLR